MANGWWKPRFWLPTANRREKPRGMTEHSGKPKTRQFYIKHKKKIANVERKIKKN